MLIVEYDAHAIAVKDIEAEEQARRSYRLYKGMEDIPEWNHIKYSTSNIFTAFRVLIAEGDIPHSDISFKYGDKIIVLDTKGRPIKGYPKGFCDVEIDLSFRLINAM
jgi:hypothetical protein